MNGLSKTVLALLLAICVGASSVLVYAALHYQQIVEYEIADTIDVRYTTESGEAYDLGTLISDETYQFLLNDSYVVKVYRFPGTLTIAFAQDNPDPALFDSFNVTVVNITDQTVIGVFNMTVTSLVFDSPAEQEYGYIFDCKVSDIVGLDGTTGQVVLLVDFDRA